ncbi:MAG TPA: efflux transporter periplasmic adaptor subunit [Planctomycetaceae bacterium]|nr:efflux transporter periplasmic adaptor subunit [Planctomycetaceae bacterium]
MHPQIKLPKPGKCPICFMDLIPLESDEGEELGPRQLRLSETAAQLAEVETTPVTRRYAEHIVRMVGKVDYDETKVVDITAWMPGRLDRLYVDYTGTTVRKGDHLVLMYSPELIVAQRELIQAVKSAERIGGLDQELSGSMARSAERKLALLGLLPDQIDAIRRSERPNDHLTIYAPSGGVVIDKAAKQGMYVQTGTKIYTIADLSVVWVFLEAYESDLPWIRYGQDVAFTTEAYPGTDFHGRVAFIEPVLDERTRTVKVRVNVPNPEGKLKPGMFVRATVGSRLAADGRVFDTSLVGKWISPMHPEIVKDGPGKCHVCGMDLVPAEQLGYGVADKAPEMPLVIPATAPLITGKRAVVYVQLPDRDQPTFEGREIVLGPRAGDSYIVQEGLREGERVVTHGNFKIDSALQIRAKPSMMAPEGGAPPPGHQHGEARPSRPENAREQPVEAAHDH